MSNEKFCNVDEVRDFILKSIGSDVDLSYFETTLKFMNNNASANAEKFVFTGEGMDLQSFLVFTRILKDWYDINFVHIAKFIDTKYKEKYSVTKAEILGAISRAMTDDVPVERSRPKVGRPKKGKPLKENDDMYKKVQTELKNGSSKSYIQRKYNLTQSELVKYEGQKYWNDSQRADHKAMLEYRKNHPSCSDKEAIEKGCGKAAVGYRYSLIPTAEEQEAYNQKANAKPVPKAVIKSTDIKSLVLSDEEKAEQQYLYDKIKEIANARMTSTREITMLFKSRLLKDYGIVIDQIKKDLMIKYNVSRGEGKAPNALEAIAMSEYLPIAKSVLDDMLSESYTIK